ncbi:MAG: TIGR02594 family protein [Chitinophagaceae bacterium]
MKEATNNNDGPSVERYLQTLGFKRGSGLPWCGAFVNWVMLQSGIKGPSAAGRASNWRKFGQTLEKPAYGSIGTLVRKGGGHVGFVVGADRNRPGWIIMLGGNQNDGVRFEFIPH